MAGGLTDVHHAGGTITTRQGWEQGLWLMEWQFAPVGRNPVAGRPWPQGPGATSGTPGTFVGRSQLGDGLEAR